MTVQDDRELNIELYVNKGRGFILSDQHELPRGAPVDLVRIDAIYNPVRLLGALSLGAVGLAVLAILPWLIAISNGIEDRSGYANLLFVAMTLASRP